MLAKDPNVVEGLKQHTLAELAQKLRDAESARMELQKSIREIASALDSKRAQVAVQLGIEDLEREHNVQIVNPDGIRTAEGFGLVGRVEGQ